VIGLFPEGLWELLRAGEGDTFLDPSLTNLLKYPALLVP